MTEPAVFRALMQRVRAGDAEAAAELVRTYEPVIRRIIRVRLTDPSLRRVLDSVDVCQSVLARFFVHVGLGDYQVETPEQLVKLLAAMARNRLCDYVRRQQADRPRMITGKEGDVSQFAGDEPTPSRIVAGKDLLKQVCDRLSKQERYLAEQRALGREWAELAAELGEKPNALRMRLRRALQRVTEDLDLSGVA